MRLFQILFLLAVLSVSAFAQKVENIKDQKANVVYRGEKINADGAISTTELLEQMEGKERLETKVEGEVVACCQMRGCWMQVDLGNGETMRVTFKDYGFFVPFDSPGKTVIMEGVAYNTTTSVDMLKHYAEDAGKSKEEIEAITKPKKELAFEATGLILK